MHKQLIDTSTSDIKIYSKKQIINADNDIDAIKIWLYQFYDTPSTFANYRKEAERFLLWCFSRNKTLKTIMFDDILLFKEFCQDPKPYDIWVSVKRYPRANMHWKPFSSSNGLGKNSLKLTETTLSVLFSWLCNAGYLNNNPFKLKRRQARKDLTVQRYLNEDLLNAILDYLNQNLKSAITPKQISQAIRCKWIISLFYLTGIRISEAICNNMSNFIKEFSKDNEEEWWLKIIGKGQKMRKIPIHPELIDILKLYRAKNLKINELPNIKEQLPLVCKKQNSKIQGVTRASLHNWIKKIFEDSKEFILNNDSYKDLQDKAYLLDKASAHWIRHTTWTHMANKNIDLRYIRDNAGHSSISTTNIYLHSEDKKRHKASVKLSLKGNH